MNRLSHIILILAAFLLVAAEEKERPPKPKSVEDFIRLGDSFLKDGKHDSAIADYSKAIELLPDSKELKKQSKRFIAIQAIYEKARLKIIKMMNDMKLHLMETETRIEKRKSNPNPELIQKKKQLEHLIGVYNSRFDELNKRFVEEESKLKKPLRLSADAFRQRGNAWKKKGDKEKSDADFKKAKELEEEQEK